MSRDFQTGLLMGMLLVQNQQLEQLVAAQQEIITLQKQVQSRTPPQPEPEAVFFHLQGDHIGAHAAANSDNLKTVLAYRQWVFDFTRQYVRPYVNQRVYQEISVHMLRGVAEHLAALDTIEHNKKSAVIHVPQQKRPPAGVN